MKALAFIRADNLRIKTLVDTFGEEIGPKEVKEISRIAIEEELYGVPIGGYSLCMKGSQMYKELHGNNEYIEKVFNPELP